MCEYREAAGVWVHGRYGRLQRHMHGRDRAVHVHIPVYQRSDAASTALPNLLWLTDKTWGLADPAVAKALRFLSLRAARALQMT
jgi:hypothetical protein